jgi:glycosyltransferase involved in cell wall biosynthesis
MKLSIIIPVYKVEKFLPRCLDSLLRQGMKSGDWAVICVNDGSPDNCGAILADYQQRYPEIFKVITQENSGAGLARDVGLRMAQGEYIGFLDADDYVVDGAYSYLYDHFCVTKPDMLSFNYRAVTTNGLTLDDPDAKPDGKVFIEGDGVDIYNRQNLDFLWTKFYRRAFLVEHQVHFHPLIYFQDELFNFDVFQGCPHLIMTDCNVVRYEHGNMDSSMRTVNRKRVLRQLDSLLVFQELMNTYLMDGNTLLAPAAQRIIYNVLNHFYKKTFAVCLSLKEWRKYMHSVKLQPFHKMTLGKSKMQKLVDMSKNMQSDTYLGYLVVRFLHLYVIRRLIA